MAKKDKGPRPYGYQLEKLAVARSCLLLPIPDEATEADCFKHAFIACQRGFAELADGAVKDQQALHHIATINRLMDTTGIVADPREGAFHQRARQMSYEEKSEFSKAVDELASWFSMEFWSHGCDD